MSLDFAINKNIYRKEMPFQKLVDCCTIEKGKTPIQKAVPGEYPLVVTTNERKTSAEYQFKKPTVCIPLVSSRGHGVACLNRVYYQEGKFALGNILCGVTPIDEATLSAKYVFYYLNHHKDTLIVPLMRGGANVALSADSLKYVKIPVPPIQVQNEIVEILEKFDALENNLSEELEYRIEQYDYYSRHLFERIKKDAMSVPVAKLGKWVGGKTPSMHKKHYWEEGTIPWISSKDVKVTVLADTEDHITDTAVKEASMKLLENESIVMVARSGILRHSLPIAYVPFTTTVNQDIRALSVNKGISAKYVAFALRAYAEDIRSYSKKQGGTVDSLEFDKVLRFEIPVPDYEKQMEIVDLLEKYQTIISDSNIGIPNELEMRKKQHWFYRNILLGFKELG